MEIDGLDHNIALPLINLVIVLLMVVALAFVLTLLVARRLRAETAGYRRSKKKEVEKCLQGNSVEMDRSW